MFDILVIGSINVDIVFSTGQRPCRGETVIGDRFATIPGGKGANQAIAAARLGANVAMIGCVGNDSYGELMLKNLLKENVCTNGIEKIESESTGVAGILLEGNDNSIVVIPGANYCVDKDLIDRQKDKILSSKLVVMQLEIPLETVEYVVSLCYENNIPVILNPAPAQKLSEEFLEKVSYLTPNKHEFNFIMPGMSEEEATSKYKNNLIITNGDEGAAFNDGEHYIKIPSIPVEVVDTTGAGDTFNGALAVALIEKMDLKKSIEFANKAAAKSVTAYGAQAGMPRREEM